MQETLFLANGVKCAHVTDAATSLAAGISARISHELGAEIGRDATSQQLDARDCACRDLGTRE
eukprot:5934506-Pleurochrysis_carterae.AAC.1